MGSVRRKRNTMGAAAALALALALSACGGAAPGITYDLTAPSEDLRGGAGRGVLVVAEPIALAALDSNRLLAISGDGSLAYLPEVQWADRLPRLFQTRLIQAFENGRRLRAVGRPGDRLLPAAQLNTELRTFAIDTRSGEAVVEVSVKIVQDRSGRILAGEIFRARVPGGGTAGGSAAGALDLASQEVIRAIVRWVSARI